MASCVIDQTWISGLMDSLGKLLHRDQLTTHVAELEGQISNISREIERQSSSLFNQ